MGIENDLFYFILNVNKIYIYILYTNGCKEKI